MPFVMLWFEWDDFESEEYRKAFIDTIWKREEELDEDEFWDSIDLVNKL